MTTAPAVLVLGEDSRIVLPILRSLGRRGLRVHVAGCAERAPAARSRYVAGWHPLPTAADDGDWQVEVRRLLQQHPFDLVIPATDMSAHRIHSDRSRWQAEARIALLNPSAYEVARDKTKTGALARSLQIPTPRPIDLTDKLEPTRGAGPRFPLVVKPVSSMARPDDEAKSFARIVDDVAELRAYAAHLRQQGTTVFVQEYVPGFGAGVEILADRGEVLFAFQHQRLHETNGHGSTYRKSVAVDSRLLHATQEIAKATSLTGVAMFEFRVDPHSERWALLEINGRFWGSLALAVHAGADFPFYLFELLVRGRRSFPQSYRCGVHSRDLFADTRWLGRRWRARRANLDAVDQTSLGWEIDDRSHAPIGADLARVLSPSHRIDSFAWDDKRPFLRDAWQLARFVGRGGLRAVLRRGRRVAPT